MADFNDRHITEGDFIYLMIFFHACQQILGGGRLFLLFQIKILTLNESLFSDLESMNSFSVGKEPAIKD